MLLKNTRKKATNDVEKNARQFSLILRKQISDLKFKKLETIYSKTSTKEFYIDNVGSIYVIEDLMFELN